MIEYDTITFPGLGIEIDINYFAYSMGLRDIRFASYLPDNGDC